MKKTKVFTYHLALEEHLNGFLQELHDRGIPDHAIDVKPGGNFVVVIWREEKEEEERDTF